MPKRGLHSIVLGGAGFIGSHLTEGLKNRGHNVCVVDNLSSTGMWPKYSIDPDLKIEGDFSSAPVANYINIYKPIVFHLAAIASVQTSIDKPLVHG